MRWLVRLLGLVVVLAGVFVVSLLLLPGDRIARIAADQISAATGREVTMAGDTTVSFFPVLGISTGPVTVANADWSEAGPMLEAERLKIGVKASALVGGDIRITGLEAVNPRIRLERAADGRVNWELGVAGVAPSGQSQEGAPARSVPLALTLDRALITDAALSYADHGSGERIELREMDFDLRWPDYAGAATFAATLRPAGEPVEVSGTLGRVDQFIDGQVSTLQGRVVVPGGRLEFTGRASAQPQVDGRLTADLEDTAAALAALGLPGARVPRGLGRSLDAAAQVTLTDDMRLAVRAADLSLDGNRLTGAADILLGGDKPRVNAQLNAGALDFSGLSGGGGADAAGGGAPSAGWSTAPIDASALAMADGELALVADSIDLGDFKLGKTRVLATLTRSRAVFDLRELRAYAGLVTGEFVVNNRSGLSVGGDITAGGIDLETFLADAVDISRFSGSADGDLRFLGVGPSVQAIMQSLEGAGAIATGRGVIRGIDLDKLMRSGQATGGTTIFDEMSASFDIAEGVLRNDDLAMVLPLARAEGEGRIDLGERRIDYLFTPVLLEGESRKGLAIPVRVRGPWADPRITPDLEEAIDRNFEEEKDALEQKAREELNRAVEKELDVEIEEGESIEDTLKKKLEDEAARELRKLFE